MCYRLLTARCIDGGTKYPLRGLPQGGAISPFLCNLVLTRLDHALEGEYRGYARYADDLAIGLRARQSVDDCLRNVDLQLRPLGLSLASDKTEVCDITSPFRYLGQTLRCKIRKGVPVRPSKAYVL